VAKKPRSEWSPAYRKRVLAAERKLRAEAKAAGRKVTTAELRQRARGHKAAEHVQRREGEAARLAAVGGLTSTQRQAVRAFAREQKRKIKQYADADDDVLVGPMLSYAARVGYEAFADQRGAQRAARRMYNAEVAEGIYESRGGGFLEAMAEGMPDPRWLYYHT
jgi:hypothetical protein